MLDYELFLNMALSEPQYSLCCTIKETDSKVEQGNDNLIACDSNGSSTATLGPEMVVSSTPGLN